MTAGLRMIDKQRKGAIVTGAVLAGMALAIYLVVLLKYFVS
ncbi:MAG: hypothetical protein ACXWHZ_02450 [Usitatibacter sp.]